MKFTQEVLIQVNGKAVTATVSVDAPGLGLDDCVNARMILTAVANEQDTSYQSRHHKDRCARVIVSKRHAPSRA